MTEQQESDSPISDEIVARPDMRYRGKHLIFSFVIIVAGFWFAYDGWIGWPRHNREVYAVESGIRKAETEHDQKKADELKTQLANMHKPYNDADLLIQKLLAVALPLAGIAYAIWSVRVTRGRLRLAGHTFEVPGAAPIDLGDIRRIDKSRWDRKGIAIVHYEAHNPRRSRSVKIDDFAYERKPTDEIVERIEAYLAPPPEMGAEMQQEPAAPEAQSGT
jgi:hypothetical protein